MKSCTITTPDNLNLHYLHWENPNSQSYTLLLHGFTNDAHIWDGLSAKLVENHNVIAFDFRGHGDSDWDNNANYTHEQLLEDTLQLINHIKPEELHIIGHSLGARVAMLLLARKPVAIESFTIIDTGPEVRAVGVKKVRKDAEATPKAFESTESYFDFLSAIYIFAEPERIQLMAQYGLKELDGKLVPKTDPAFTAALWKQDSDNGDSTDLKYPLNDELWLALARIKAPTLILKGQASAILAKQTAEKMAHKIMPNAQLKEISKSGHALMVDNSEEFEGVMIDFLAGI